MILKEDVIFITHILESIEAVEKFSKNMSRENFAKSRLKQSAIIREIEIIGEAVKNISGRVKENYCEVLWKEISGARDKMIHNYFGIDLEIVWEIIKIGLPDLKKQMLKIKLDLEKSK